MGWVIGVAIIVIIGACVVAIFFGGGDRGPFVGLSRLGRSGKVTTSRGRTDFHDDLRKPRNENELP